MPLYSLYGSALGNIRWCPSLALGSLFKTKRYPQSLAVSFGPDCASLSCPTEFPSAKGPGVVHLISNCSASTTFTCLQKGLWCYWEGGIPGSPLQHSVKMVEGFLTPLSFSVTDYFQQCMVSSELAVRTCEEPTCVKGAALSFLVLMATLPKSQGSVEPEQPLLHLSLISLLSWFQWIRV